MDKIILKDLNPLEYEHPFDAKALDLLQKTRGLDTIVRQFNKHAVEKAVKIQFTGSNIRIKKERVAPLYSLLDEVCKTINLPIRPDLYIQWDYNINASVIGVEKPIIVLTSSAIDLLSDDELAFIIGHELGHIKSGHNLYHQIAMVLPVMADVVGSMTLNLSNLLSKPLQIALFAWSRMSEFTSDRAGLLACQNIDVAISVMMKLAGMPKKYYDSIIPSDFVEQAREFNEFDFDTLSKAIKFYSILNRDHPWNVIRVAKLISWIENGSYNEIISRSSLKKLNAQRGDINGYCRVCSYRLDGSEKFCPVCGNTIIPSHNHSQQTT